MPTQRDVVALAQEKVGVGEDPPHSNHNAFTVWYGQGDGPWCLMFVSWILANAGFSADNGATLTIPGIVCTTSRGWAYVPYVLNDFRDAHRVVDAPQPGDIATYHTSDDTTPDHAGIVESIINAQSFWSIEGNYSDAVCRVRRTQADVAGFCRPPYDGAATPPLPKRVAVRAPNAPPFPGYCSIGSRDNATRAVQQRLADRGWNVQPDGIFGAQTYTAIIGFQAEKGLTADGVVGPITWNSLWT